MNLDRFVSATVKLTLASSDGDWDYVGVLLPTSSFVGSSTFDGGMIDFAWYKAPHASNWASGSSYPMVFFSKDIVDCVELATADTSLPSGYRVKS